MENIQVFFVLCLLDVRKLISVVCVVNLGK